MEGKEREHYEKKRKVRQALEEGKPIPTELRNVESELRREIDLEDENTASQFSLLNFLFQIFASNIISVPRQFSLVEDW